MEVKWFEFQAGPPILEAMNAGSVSLGMTGDSPPIFAQSAGAEIVYIGQEPAKAGILRHPGAGPPRRFARWRI